MRLASQNDIYLQDQIEQEAEGSGGNDEEFDEELRRERPPLSPEKQAQLKKFNIDEERYQLTFLAISPFLSLIQARLGIVILSVRNA